MSETAYVCHNAACPLGSRIDQGRFSGGLTEEGAAVLGLDPDHNTGEGYCPNCGDLAVPEEN